MSHLFTEPLPLNCPKMWSQVIVPFVAFYVISWLLTATLGVRELGTARFGNTKAYSPCPFIVVDNNNLWFGSSQYTVKIHFWMILSHCKMYSYIVEPLNNNRL